MSSYAPLQPVGLNPATSINPALIFHSDGLRVFNGAMVLANDIKEDLYPPLRITTLQTKLKQERAITSHQKV